MINFNIKKSPVKLVHEIKTKQVLPVSPAQNKNLQKHQLNLIREMRVL